jgi:hypothetical protein
MEADLTWTSSETATLLRSEPPRTFFCFYADVNLPLLLLLLLLLPLLLLLLLLLPLLLLLL